MIVSYLSFFCTICSEEVSLYWVIVKIYYFLPEKWIWYILISVRTRNRQYVLGQYRLGIYGAIGSVWGTVCEEREQEREESVCMRKLIVQLTYRGFPKSLSSLWMYLKHYPMKCNYIFKM